MDILLFICCVAQLLLLKQELLGCCTEFGLHEAAKWISERLAAEGEVVFSIFKGKSIDGC